MILYSYNAPVISYHKTLCDTRMQNVSRETFYVLII
ncbi:MAG TPA: hypothetical protein DHV15_09435 [Treponema sp.]|uniref:Uncharacterized protein n=1 Tax=Treponema denticola (strain ATCC 35405 / DSM 14222 / CIP 103919 / JCM 8153 / KCTC 15104) TaxID=243275 RepID=Q73R76_TREDE|nr:hypothetical protein TDE_0215 [Treponema denticola ATCC 35405]HCY95716.1 hypothetical protein [Treponema sp.]